MLEYINITDNNTVIIYYVISYYYTVFKAYQNIYDSISMKTKNWSRRSIINADIIHGIL